MRPLAALVAALAAVPGTLAVDQKKSAIIWFEDPTTPDSVIDQAKESIVRAGGQITHVCSIRCVCDAPHWLLSRSHPLTGPPGALPSSHLRMRWKLRRPWPPSTACESKRTRWCPPNPGRESPTVERPGDTKLGRMTRRSGRVCQHAREPAQRSDAMRRPWSSTTQAGGWMPRLLGNIRLFLVPLTSPGAWRCAPRYPA